MKKSLFSNGRALWTAWAGWAALFLITAAMVVGGSGRTVVPSYRLGALNWLHGQGLYDGAGVGGFVYFPQAAILFAPFAMFSPTMGEVLWRLAVIGMFALGLRSFARLAVEGSGKDLFPLMTLVSILLAWDCARNGQATLAMTGLMLFSIVDVAKGRWWRATLWLALGVAVKPLAIVLMLLIAAVERPMIWRLFLGTAALALAPFLTQHPAYVLEQYAACLGNMRTAAHVGVVVQGWTTPFTALRVAGIDVPEWIQTVLRVLAAFGTLGLCFLVQQRHDRVRSAVFVFSLAVLYLMLFSPRTENNTYVMLGPAIAVFLARALVVEKRFAAGILLSSIALALLGSRVLERMLTPHAEASWVSPLMAICFGVYLLVRMFSEPEMLSDANGET